ncbi:MAG: response regulator transcription factor [Oscillibacter sp.]|jgi:two-component system copper resistance phosphate regulon response regulator CusR|nr:response regulator transcription factor [Oscillibacter sp.]
MRLLLVEDERALRTVLAERLKKEGYSVDACDNGDDAAAYLQGAPYDLAVMDIMLPGRDGLSVLRETRAAGRDTPVLLLTARDSIEDRVRGLDAGADDYLVKPFAFDELVARVRVLTRRKFNSSTNLLTAADLTLDCASRTVTRGGKKIALSAKEYALLSYLLHNRDIVLTREQIEDHVWNYDYEGGSNVIDVYIRLLRKKIDDPFPRKLIHTLRGQGYVLREDPD